MPYLGRMNTMMIRAVLVDDEEPARSRLKRLLAEAGGVEVVAEAADGPQAIERIHEVRPDLVFLDIEMPGCTGLDVAAALRPPRPRIIFCTAYDQYALDAFEVNAIDYMLKPLNTDRLKRALRQIKVDLDERRAASRGQARLMPDEGAVVPGLDVSGVCLPAGDVGGDYYDFLALPDGKLGLMVADVSGKGLFAGLLMAGLQARLHGEREQAATDPAALLRGLNRWMIDSAADNRYISLVYAVIDPADGRGRFVNAGAPAPMVIGGPGAPQELPATGPPVGMFADAVFDVGTLALDTGESLVAFTDGVSEAADPAGRDFGREGVLEACRKAGDGDAGAIRSTILAALGDFRGTARVGDDVTLAVVRRPGLS